MGEQGKTDTRSSGVVHGRHTQARCGAVGAASAAGPGHWRGVAAIAVNVVDVDAGRIEQHVRVRPPTEPDAQVGFSPGAAEVDVDYLVSPPELTPFLIEALQSPGPYEQTLEEATRGQLAGPARQIAQELLGVSHLLACRIESGLDVIGLLVFAMQRPTNPAERPLVADFASRIADALPISALGHEQPRENQTLLHGILAVADAARLAASDRIDALLASIPDRLRVTLAADSVYLALPDGSGWQIAVSFSDSGGQMHVEWSSGQRDEAPGGIAGWVLGSRQPALVVDIREDRRASAEHDGRAAESAIAVPLDVRGRTVGVLRVGSGRISRFAGADLDALKGLAQQTAMVVENAQLYVKTRAQNERLAQFARVVASSPDAIVLADLDEHIHHCNPSTERLFGYGEAELVGRRVSALLGVASLLALRLGESSGVGEWNRELRLTRKDGTAFPAEIDVSLVQDDDGGPLGSATIVRDLTTRKELET
jgi:two-component system, NtrC family, sensor histidine kinase KinB